MATGIGKPENIDKATLSPIVQKALNSDSFSISDWEITPFRKIPGRREVYRFSGRGKDQGQELLWSLFLKGIFRGDPASEAKDLTWKREVLVYEADLMEDISGSLRAPKCLEIINVSDNEVWAWFEDVSTNAISPLPLEQYGVAARHLGQFNGAYLVGKPLPQFPWLDGGRLRSSTEAAANGIEILRQPENSAEIRSFYQDDMCPRLLRLWEQRDSFLNHLFHQMPKTFGHLDASGRNLFILPTSAGKQETVAIDWEYAGNAPLGEEIACLVGSSLTWLFKGELDQAPALDDIVFSNYLEGLSEVGWQGDPRLIRYAYTAALALQYALRYGGIVAESIGDEQALSGGAQMLGFETSRDLLSHINTEIAFLLDLADEAFRLQKELNL